jgi:hypothetical protein
MVFNQYILSTIGVIALSYLGLKIFYKVFKLEWPELYFSLNDKTALYVSVSLKRYAAFRFLPVFMAISLFSGIFMKNYDLQATIYVSLASGVFYGLTTDGLAIFRILTRSKDIRTYFNSWYQVLLHIITILFLIAVGVIAGVAAHTPFVSSITPTPQGLVDNVWSSLIVVILAFYFKDILSGQGPSEDLIFGRSLENIPPQVLHAIEKYSAKNNANKILVKAICIAENLQRPPWVRKIESVTRFFRSEGTYGIMQVKSKKQVSDVKSVNIAISQYFKNTAWITDIDKLKAYIKLYNNDERYAEIVLRVMHFLDYSSVQYNQG